MDKQITIAANTNTNPLRAIMYETSAPNVAVQAIDIPLPHNVSQQIVFTGLNDVSHWFRLYEVVGMVLGTQLSDSLIQPTVKSVYCDLPIELSVGVAPTDKITPAVNNYNGTVEFPQYAGKVAKTDYWVEQRGVGQLKDDEYTNNTDPGVTFGFKLTGTALFNDADTYFIKFRPIILVNPANFPAARVELFTDIVLVNTSRTIAVSYTHLDVYKRQYPYSDEINIFNPVITIKPSGKYKENRILNINLLPGEVLYLISHAYNFYPAEPTEFETLGSEIYIESLSRFKTTTIKAKKALSVGNELIKKIADNTHSLESNILKNTTIAISCGDAIRGIDNPILKTNFKDLFTSLNRNLEIAGSINNKKFIIEAKKTAYNNTLLYDLGEIKDAKFDFYEPLLANSIKLGYANQDYDDLNGRDEFNNTSEFKAPITRVNKLYDLTAPYRGDMFGIEFTRINLQGKTTTDNNSDNDVFMLDVEYDFTDADGIENYKLRRPSFTSITGLIDPTGAFNIDLSPKRIFNKHGAWIRGMMWPLTTEKITFQTTDKNPLLKTVQGGVTIQENADVVISDLEPNYWIPITIKFETVVPDNLVDIMQSNSTGLFQCTHNGDTYKGWVIACSQKPSTDVEQQWTLLLSADNNINKLIHG